MKPVLLIIFPALLLSLLGLVMLASIAPNRLLPQCFFLFLAIILGWIVWRVKLKNWLLLATPIYIGIIILLLATFLFGNIARGSTRWLQFGSFRFQASEFAKPAILLMATNLFLTKQKLLKKLLVFVPVLIIVLLQPDLGTAISLGVILLSIVIFSGIPRKFLIGIFISVLFLIPAGRLVLKEYQLRRLDTFLNPYSDPKGAGYQVIQSTIAIGSGMLFGRGLGHGTQSQLQFLPERYTDFIFSALVEELGLIGGVVTLFLYTSIITGLIWGAFQVKKKPQWLFLTGAASWLFFQTGVNIAMNMGWAPVTGIPLPFLSSGGSSLLATSFMLSLAAQASQSS